MDEVVVFGRCVGLRRNEAIALAVLIEKGRLTIMDIAKALDVSYPLASRIASELVGRGLATAYGVAKGPGRPVKIITADTHNILALLEECITKLERLRETLKEKAEASQAHQS